MINRDGDYMNVKFEKRYDGIYCKIKDITCDDFIMENEKYCYKGEFEDNEFEINFKVYLNSAWHFKDGNLDLKNKYADLKKKSKKYSLIFYVPKDKFHINESKKRFYFYQEQTLKMSYSFKLVEITDGTFDYNITKSLMNKKSGKKGRIGKKKHLTEEERRINRQKWALQHPFQGGGFSPR